MPFASIIWDLDDDPDGNVQHCAEHGVTKEEAEEVFQNATDADISGSSGRPVVFGDTSTGRHLMVAYEQIDAETVYPVTAYDAPRRHRHETHHTEPAINARRSCQVQSDSR